MASAIGRWFMLGLPCPDYGIVGGWPQGREVATVLPVSSQPLPHRPSSGMMGGKGWHIAMVAVGRRAAGTCQAYISYSP